MALIHAIYEPFKNQMLHPSSPEPLPSCIPHLLNPSLPASLISCTLPFLHPSFLPLSFPASFQSRIHSICPASHQSCILYLSCPASFLYTILIPSFLSWIPLHCVFPVLWTKAKYWNQKYSKKNLWAKMLANKAFDI